MQELSASEMDEITNHLANCGSCEGDYLLEQMMNSAIVRSCTEDAPDELAKRVAERIRLLAEESHYKTAE